MRTPTFADFFEAVHGFGPFPWQERMAEAVLAGDPPSAVTVPPGLGKTSALDAWVWALAIDLEQHGAQRTVPLRAVFVVDRRGIVDAAHDHAESIISALVEADDGPGAWARGQLMSSGVALRSPIEAVKMRGGVSWASRWMRQPDQPAVVTGTVDQFGSRFLFRGYGVSDRMRPIDAALVGTDAIVFLDEAHLSTALVGTVRDSVAMERQRSADLLSRPVTVVPMTATPGVDADVRTSLTVSDDDRNHPIASARLVNSKLARLVEVPSAVARKANDELAAAMADRAVSACGEGRAVLVVCNTIGLARMVHGLLLGKHGVADAHLSIGRGRDIDKEASRQRWWKRLKANRDGRTSDGGDGVVLVSTQTIEVGADLDVDVLVTEAAPLDALIQRFGRVDRLGELGVTRSTVMYHPVRSSPDHDLVYGGATSNTWNWLVEESNDEDAPVIDMGVSALTPRLERLHPLDRADLLAPLPEVPGLYPAIIDQLARTDPTNGIVFPVDTYLHGLARSEPKVSVLWRADLVGLETDDDVQVRLELLPPTTAEAVEVPLVHVLRFLAAAPVGGSLADLDAMASPEEPVDAPQKRPYDGPCCWAVRSDGDLAPIKHPRDVRPNDVLVMQSHVGGHDVFGWTGGRDDGEVPDVADLVASAAGSTRLRVDGDVFRSLGVVTPAVDVAVGGLHEVLRAGKSSEELSSRVESLLEALAEAAVRSPYAGSLKDLLDRLGSAKGWLTTRSKSTSAAGWVECVDLGDSSARVDAETFGDEWVAVLHGPRPRRVALEAVIDVDDRAGTSSTGVLEPVPLQQHLGAVGTRARAFAEHLGLSPALCEAIEWAGRAHDLGKIDPRFQTILRSGDWLRAAAGEGLIGEAVAKSARGRGRSRTPIPDEWRWPPGMRHEAVSLALVRGAELPESLDRELIEHLVASHHGWSRPLFPAVVDDNARKVNIEFDGQHLTASSDDLVVEWGAVGRFDRLCRTYGWWGLALLETIVRLADMAVSEEGS